MRFAVLLALAGCAAAPPPAPAPPAPAERTLALDGAVVQAAPDPLTGREFYDPEELFELAREAERTERYDDARALYRRLLEQWPDSGWAAPSAFNLGLLHERGEAWADAVRAYALIAERPLPEDAEARRTYIDAHYRAAVCLGKQKSWWAAVTLFEAVLALPELDTFDRLEAVVGRGIALREAGEPESAEVALAQALRIQAEASREGPFDDRGLVAEAAFTMGEIAADRYAKVELAFPVELLRQRLEEKCELLLSAQHRFLRAIRHGDAHTVAAAGFRIGWLYENLHDSIVGLQIPAELSAEQAEVYQEEVRARVLVLVKKAIMVYEKSLVVGKTATTATPWIARIEQALERLKRIYLSDTEPKGAPPS